METLPPIETNILTAVVAEGVIVIARTAAFLDAAARGLVRAGYLSVQSFDLNATCYGPTEEIAAYTATPEDGVLTRVLLDFDGDQVALDANALSGCEVRLHFDRTYIAGLPVSGWIDVKRNGPGDSWFIPLSASSVPVSLYTPRHTDRLISVAVPVQHAFATVIRDRTLEAMRAGVIPESVLEAAEQAWIKRSVRDRLAEQTSRHNVLQAQVNASAARLATLSRLLEDIQE